MPNPAPHPAVLPPTRRLPLLALATFTAACAALGVPATAQAQKMYRCGNVYQDRPCNDGQDGKVVNTTGAGTAVQAKPTASVLCTQRGEEAQRIMWQRETGRTEEMLLANTEGRSPELISDVYRRRGSAATVRSAIEADCMAEQERSLQAGLLPALPQPAAAGAASAPDAGPSAAELEAQNRRRDEQAAQQAAAARKARCADLSTRLDILRRSQRSGGSAAEADNWNQQFRRAQQQLREAGCG